ncbi:MAG TPA: hypothetical protein VNU71_13760 [Burkholderiaceae bacterium]|nr:hypothetical protein [Burkholderiaceae bacterium]
MNLSITAVLRLFLAVAIAAAWWPLVTRARPVGAAAVVAALVLTAVLLGVGIAQARWRRRSALQVIRGRPLPSFLRAKLKAAHPQLDDAALRDVERGLRQFFAASAQVPGRYVAMPSKVVDTLWHEFILHTRAYEAFCRRAFGRLLHHTPAEALPRVSARGGTQYEGLLRAWDGACREEGLDPRRPARLPLLFALDGALGIAGGYTYALDCRTLGRAAPGTHCAADLSAPGSDSGSGDGSSRGDDGGGSGDAGSSSDASGDGGGGDGGGSGCGGGGD